jgi:hypothetical protein
MDLAEVSAMVMSKKAYIKKWRELSDEDADKELEQIKKEQDFFNNSEMIPSEDEYNNSLDDDSADIDSASESAQNDLDEQTKQNMVKQSSES